MRYPARCLHTFTIVLVVLMCFPGPLAAEESSLKLILNDPVGRAKPMDGCEVELCSSLVALLDGATKTIDFAIYGMRHQSAVLEALKRAKARGVVIRGVVDRDLNGKNYYSSTEELVAAMGDVRSDLKVELIEAREAEKRRSTRSFVDKCKRPKGFKGPLQCLAFDLGHECLYAAHASRDEIKHMGGIMHNKFFVVDGARVWTGSTNVSDSGTGGYNANLVTVITSPRVAGWYTAEFEQMYVHGRYHSKKRKSPTMRAKLDDGTIVELGFSPQDKPISEMVRPLLRKARRNIDVGVFFLTHKKITQDLIDAHLRGVKVRVIIDATAAKNGYTKHELLRAVGIPVKVENWGGKMHMKSATIDGHIVITGSMNWTSAGEGGNDENTVVIFSAKLARQYEDFFNIIWTEIPDQWRQGRPDPESKDSTTACTDGVDNDFDHEADGADPGCGDKPPPLPALPPHRKDAKRGERCSPYNVGR